MRGDGASSPGGELLLQLRNTFFPVALLLDQLEIDGGTHDIFADAFFDQVKLFLCLIELVLQRGALDGWRV